MFKNNLRKSLLAGVSLILALTFAAPAQTKRKPTAKKTTKKAVAAKTTTVAAEEAANVPPAVKKNSRPAEESETPVAPVEKTAETVKTNSRPSASEPKPVYFYEFSKSDFTISKINIEHDENGKGKITFQKKDFAEPITDPIQLSATALERIKSVWKTLDFLDSTENYQTARDYSNLGAVKFSIKRDNRTREATFNWTDNKDAKNLADEYRRIGQQFVWIFDMSVARENQPLNAPRLLDALDAMIKRNEVSDAAQMLPLLGEISNDERVPLIARNHAVRLSEKIQAAEKKKEK